jgi:acetyl-CoA carboxylase biotin carboxyl carrier protein
MAKSELMNLKEIQNLIKFVAKSGASEVDLEMDGVKITIKTPAGVEGKTETIIQQVPVGATAPAQAAPAPAPAPAAQPAAPAPAADKGNENAEESNDNYITINSPMIGTFYRRPSPDKDLFVNVGDTVKEGDIVCIIEAMKLFNEIESEVSGKIVKVLVEDSTPVEYGQPLFLVDPS